MLSLCRKVNFLQNHCTIPIIKRTLISTLKNLEHCNEPQSRGLVLGVYANEDDRFDSGLLTPFAAKYNELRTKGRLLELLRLAGPMPRRGECRIFYNLENDFSSVAVCGLGSECYGYNSHEHMDESKEAIRIASAVGCRALQKLHTSTIHVESFGHSESSAEGAALGLWMNQSSRTKNKQEFVPQIQLHTERGMDSNVEGWRIGLHKASAQNLARQLMETPANLMTPTMFAQNIVQVLCKSGVNVEVKVRGWAERQGMQSFLNVAKGSCEPPIFLELSYYGTDSDERPIVLIGQGNTFDSGGICLKAHSELIDMRGDMAGAAVVVATCRAIAALKLPVNIRALIPLCENMIGGNAIKPGDVCKANNGKSIEVEDSDHEEPLVLIDALLYSQNFWPKSIIDIGTLHPDMINAMGKVACGVYTNSEDMWKGMKQAAIHTGDRVWKFPLWNYFSEQITASDIVDIQNVGHGEGGGSCKAAAFLREFVPCGPWMHIEAASVMTTNGSDYPYLRIGMAGRPTRTLIEYIAQSICKDKPYGLK